MGYRRHTWRAKTCWTDPGERDITAHVNFTALRKHGAAPSCTDCGAPPLRTLAQTLLAAGEPDQFAARSISTMRRSKILRRRMQLKTLLFGMGETFRVLLQVERRNALFPGTEGPKQ
jgi:SAM-dependent MidA family methyltransferase